MDYVKEKQEAINAGERALCSLREAQRQISGAKGFGLWDLLGGGTFVSIAKHFKINNAQQAIERAKYDLQTFSRELNDIHVSLDVNIGDFWTVMDLFDSFLADVVVQSKLADASRRLDEVICRVEQTLNYIK